MVKQSHERLVAPAITLLGQQGLLLPKSRLRSLLLPLWS